MLKFQLYKDVQGYYRWRFIAANGEKLCSSEAYSSKDNALYSIQLVKQYAAGAVIV